MLNALAYLHQYCHKDADVLSPRLHMHAIAGDVMILKSDTSLRPCLDFTAQIQTLDIPGENKIGYSPIGFVRCGRSACRLQKINWKVGSTVDMVLVAVLWFRRGRPRARVWSMLSLALL